MRASAVSSDFRRPESIRDRLAAERLSDITQPASWIAPDRALKSAYQHYKTGHARSERDPGEDQQDRHDGIKFTDKARRRIRNSRPDSGPSGSQRLFLATLSALTSARTGQTFRSNTAL
jgi:hypothetical protein